MASLAEKPQFYGLFVRSGSGCPVRLRLSGQAQVVRSGSDVPRVRPQMSGLRCPVLASAASDSWLFGFSDFSRFSGVHLPVHPPPYTARLTVPSTNTVYAVERHARCVIFSSVSGRIRWYPDQLITAENVKLRLRLDRRAAISTCVCQAKSLF